MNTLKSLLRKHLWAVIFALVVGAMSVAPHLLAVRELGDAYKGIPFMYTNNEDYYLARIQEIKDGHPLVVSPYLYEYKDGVPLVPPVGEYLYIFLSLVTGLSLSNTLVLAKFLFPASLFLLAYALGKNLLESAGVEKIRSDWMAVAIGLSVTLGYDLVDLHFLFLRLTGEFNQEILSLWTRPVNPVTGALFLFGFLLLIWKALHEKSRAASIGAGLLAALGIGYFFSFVIVATLLLILMLIYLVRKDWQTFRLLATTASVAIIIDLPYLLAALQTLASGTGENSAARNGLLLTHEPILNKMLLLATIIFIIGLIFIRKREPEYLKSEKGFWLWFLGSTLAASWLVFNEQIATGRTIWPYHFVQYTIPIAIVVSLIIIFLVLYRYGWPKIATALVGIIVVATLTFGVWNVSTYRASESKLPHFKHMQGYATLFDWINKNTEKDCVILVNESGEELGMFIPAFTHCNVYFSAYINNNMPTERILQNYMVQMKLWGVGAENVETYLLAHEDSVKSYFYSDWLELFSRTHSPRLEAVIKNLAEQYQQFEKVDFESNLKQYRINFIIEQNNRTKNIREVLPSIMSIFKTSSTIVYTFPPR